MIVVVEARRQILEIAAICDVWQIGECVRLCVSPYLSIFHVQFAHRAERFLSYAEAKRCMSIMFIEWSCWDWEKSMNGSQKTHLTSSVQDLKQNGHLLVFEDLLVAILNSGIILNT
jgi:hypothetical protein